MNSIPGREGAGSNTSFNWEQVNIAKPENWQRTFRSVEITNKSRRLFLCDSVEWQVVPASSATGTAAFPDYHRHGKDTCSVLFYDGHVASLKSADLNRALFEPGKL